jgi:hypothetical protein
VVKSLSLILFLAIGAMPGCSHFSSSARDQRAYAKYVRKSATVREKQQKHFLQEKSEIPPEPAPSDWQVTAETVEAPQAVSSDSGNQ